MQNAFGVLPLSLSLTPRLSLSCTRTRARARTHTHTHTHFHHLSLYQHRRFLFHKRRSPLHSNPRVGQGTMHSSTGQNATFRRTRASQGGHATQGPSWGYSKVNLLNICHFLAINTHKMAPRTTQWFQERPWDAPTKGLAWSTSVSAAEREGAT